MNRTLHSNRSSTAFTLTEMLVVISIIGIMASMALPAIKGLTKSNTMAVADRQLLDDVAAARQKAVNNRTTVYMVFVPPSFWTNTTSMANLGTNAQAVVDTLLSGQYTSYALLSFRKLGDQPGQSSASYLTSWKALPEGTFIALDKFARDVSVTNAADLTRPFEVRQFLWTNIFPFPTAELPPTGSPYFSLPYIAFGPEGNLVGSDGKRLGRDEYIPIARGSIFYARDAAGKLRIAPPDIVETPAGDSTNNFNLIHIDGLTGRARVEQPELR